MTTNNKPNGSKHIADVITSLLSSGDAWVKLLTLGLIIFSGWGNWNATQHVGQASSADWQQARSEINQFFKNQQTYLQSLQLLQQNNADTAWIRNILQQNTDIIRRNNEVSRSNNSELSALKEEIEKMKAELAKPVEQRKFQ